MIAASVQLAPIWLFADPLPALTALAPGSVAAVIGIGLFSTALAALVFFSLIAQSGAAFQSLTNYLLPVWAVFIGFTLLDETLPPNAFIALALILISLWLSGERPLRRRGLVRD